MGQRIFALLMGAPLLLLAPLSQASTVCPTSSNCSIILSNMSATTSINYNLVASTGSCTASTLTRTTVYVQCGTAYSIYATPTLSALGKNTVQFKMPSGNYAYVNNPVTVTSGSTTLQYPTQYKCVAPFKCGHLDQAQ